MPAPIRESANWRECGGREPYDAYMRSSAYGSKNPALPFKPGSGDTEVVESVGTIST